MTQGRLWWFVLKEHLSFGSYGDDQFVEEVDELSHVLAADRSSPALVRCLHDHEAVGDRLFTVLGERDELDSAVDRVGLSGYVP